MKLRSFHGFDGLNAEEYGAICNGAGAAGDWRSKFIPETMWGLPLRAAFDRHDYGYHIGKTSEDKWDADIDFFVNCIILILGARSNILLTYARGARAFKYFLAVHYKGNEAFYKS